MVDEIVYKHFSGLKLFKARTALSLSRERLGAAIGCSLGTILNWETGQSSPNADKLERLSAALNQPLSYFYAEGKPDAVR